MDMTIQSPGVRRLRLRIEAMRRLPPGTPLPQPADVREQRVLGDVLALPDETDPLRWLSDERGTTTALLTLRLLLEQARDVCRSAETRPSAWPSLPPEYHAILGNLLDGTSDEDIWYDLPLDPAVAVDPERLRATFREVRRVRGQRVASAFVGEDWLQLLAMLLDLPNEVDPVGWLADEEAATSARLALSHIVDQCLPHAMCSGLTVPPA